MNSSTARWFPIFLAGVGAAFMFIAAKALFSGHAWGVVPGAASIILLFISVKIDWQKFAIGEVKK